MGKRFKQEKDFVLSLQADGVQTQLFSRHAFGAGLSVRGCAWGCVAEVPQSLEQLASSPISALMSVRHQDTSGRELSLSLPLLMSSRALSAVACGVVRPDLRPGGHPCCSPSAQPQPCRCEGGAGRRRHPPFLRPGGSTSEPIPWSQHPGVLPAVHKN